MIIKAHWTAPISSTEIENAGLRILNSKINDIGHSKDIEKKYPRDQVIDLGNAVILPGFVNAHSHLAYSAFEGFLENYSFLEWLRVLSMIKYELLDHDDFLISSFAGMLTSLKNGITTVADCCDFIEPFYAAKKIGLRMAFFYEVFGWEPEKAIAHLRNALAVIEKLNKMKTNLQIIGLSPHSPYTVSSYFFKLIYKTFCNNPIPISIHIAESSHEYDLITRNQGKLVDFLALKSRTFTGNYASILSYLESTHILKLKPLLVHGIFLTDKDMKILEKYKLSIIHCPTSNSKFGHGIAPLSDFAKYQIPWGLGTDGQASNNRMDMIQEMRMALLFQRNITHNISSLREKEVIKTATLQNAHLLNLERIIGSLEPGKDADIIAIKLPDLHVHPSNDIYSTIIHNCVAEHVQFTMIKGKIKYCNGNFFSISLPKNFRCKLQNVRNKIQKGIDSLKL